jgi:monovalent cation/hydrogen antiporter
VTFAVILATLVGQGLTLPLVVRWVRWDGVDADGDEATFARQTVYRLGLDAVRYSRTRWPDHEPLLDRLESGLGDRMQHLATEDADETEERDREHREHEEIQLYVINAQRAAAIELRDAGEINDATLRELERELDLEELRMEG